jgi:dolichol-phosphate mannosyltransferase
VQAARLGLRIKEVGVPRLYLDPTRAFGGVLDDAEQRLAYYRRVLDAAYQEELPVARHDHSHDLPAVCSLHAPRGACR